MVHDVGEHRRHHNRIATAVSSLQVPKVIATFLRAANTCDIVALVKTFADDAVLTDMGRQLQGDGLRRWADGLFGDANAAVHPIDATEREGRTLLSVIIHGTKPAARAYLRRNWRFTLDGGRIAALDIAEAKEPDLPSPVAAFVQSTNACDLEGLMAVFSEDAMVNDDLQERWGKAAIRKWAEEEFIGQRVTIFVVKCIEHHRIVTITAYVDGDFDRRGLPYPLVLTFYFSLDSDDVVQLIILRNQPN